MPNLVVYVPMRIWKTLEAMEGTATKQVARSIANRAIEHYIHTGSAPVGTVPSLPPEPSGTGAFAVEAKDTGADISLEK